MPDPFTRPVFARMRRQCLALPGVTEKLAWGHPCFRVSNRMFCAFEIMHKRPSVAFRLPEQSVALDQQGVAFITPYGRGQWASVYVDQRVDWPLLAMLLNASYRGAASARLRATLDEKGFPPP